VKKKLNFLEINDYCFELIMHSEQNYYYFFPLFSLSEHPM